MIFLEAFLGKSRRMPPRNSFVNQYLLPVMVLSSIITCTENLPLKEMAPTEGGATTPKPVPTHHHRHRHHNHSASRECPFGTGGMVGDSVHCCKHGGVPVMNRCACPRNYGGEYCELKKRSCLHVPHGGVFTKGCALCTCQYGVVSCITRAFKQCSSMMADEADDGRMLTYDLRSRQQKQKAIKKYPILVKSDSSSGHTRNKPSILALTILLLALTLLGG